MKTLSVVELSVDAVHVNQDTRRFLRKRITKMS